MTRGHNSAAGLVTKRDFDDLAQDFSGFEKNLEAFNIFRILRFEHGEIRHSNFLAWLLQPAEPHGLGITFLAALLARICRDAGKPTQSRLIHKALVGSPLVQVVREWSTGGDGALDLLLRIRGSGSHDLVIAIENKVWAKQSQNQLRRYREAVRKAFPVECEFLYIFLSKRDQSPHDRNWIRANYKQVSDELRGALIQRKASIGKEAALFIKQYLEILEDNNVNEKAIRRHAESLYSKHKRAIDVLITYKPGYERTLTDLLKSHVECDAKASKVRIMHCEKNYIRFLPEKLDTSINGRGSTWGGLDAAYILCEISFWDGAAPDFGIVEGKSPDDFRKRLWKLAAAQKFPGRASQRRLPKDYIWLYTANLNKKVGESEYPDEKKAAGEIWKWVKKEMKTKRFRDAVSKIANELKTLADKPPEVD